MAAVTERSAGVVIYRVERDTRLFLLLDYGKYWDYAKGHVEPGEDDLTAARREVTEETGITRLDLDAEFRHEIAYFFRGRRGLVRKEVIFFLGRTDETRVTISHEHKGYDWLSFDAAVERLTYASAKDVLKAAQARLDVRHHESK